MNWEAVASIGESISALAILITLIFLVRQIKYARLAASDISRGQRVAGIRELDLLAIENSELRKIWLKAGSPEMREVVAYLSRELDISEEEADLLRLYAGDWVWTHWAQYRSIRTESDTVELEHIISTFYSADPMKTFIKNPLARDFFDNEFLDWIEVLVKKNDE